MRAPIVCSSLALLVLVAACNGKSGPSEAGSQPGSEAGNPEAGNPEAGNGCGGEGEICGGQCVNWKYIMSCGDCPKSSCLVTYFVDCGDGRCFCLFEPYTCHEAGPGDVGPPDASPDT